MKAYLNKIEKTQALTLAAFVSYVANIADEWKKIGRSTDAVKSFRMAKSFVLRSLDTMFEGIDDSERNNLIGQFDKMEVVVKYNKDAIRDYKQMLELDSVTPIQTSDLLDLCEKAMVACNKCTTSPATCGIRILFIKYDIPVCDDSPGIDKCPYYNE